MSGSPGLRRPVSEAQLRVLIYAAIAEEPAARTAVALGAEVARDAAVAPRRRDGPLAAARLDAANGGVDGLGTQLYALRGELAAARAFCCGVNATADPTSSPLTLAARGQGCGSVADRAWGQSPPRRLFWDPTASVIPPPRAAARAAPAASARLLGGKAAAAPGPRQPAVLQGDGARCHARARTPGPPRGREGGEARVLTFVGALPIDPPPEAAATAEPAAGSLARKRLALTRAHYLLPPALRAAEATGSPPLKRAAPSVPLPRLAARAGGSLGAAGRADPGWPQPAARGAPLVAAVLGVEAAAFAEAERSSSPRASIAIGRAAAAAPSARRTGAPAVLPLPKLTIAVPTKRAAGAAARGAAASSLPPTDLQQQQRLALAADALAALARTPRTPNGGTVDDLLRDFAAQLPTTPLSVAAMMTPTPTQTPTRAAAAAAQDPWHAQSPQQPRALDERGAPSRFEPQAEPDDADTATEGAHGSGAWAGARYRPHALAHAPPPLLVSAAYLRECDAAYAVAAAAAAARAAERRAAPPPPYAHHVRTPPE